MDAPAVAGSADGKTLAVAWMDGRTGDPNVYWSPLPGGFAASSEAVRGVKEGPVHNSSLGKQSHPALAIGPKGEVIAVWEDSRPGWQAIVAATSRHPQQNFLLSDRAEGKASYPAVAAGGKVTVVVYESGRQIHLRRLEPPQ